MSKFQRAKRQRKSSVVLIQDEVKLLLSNMHSTYRLMASVLYGSGLRNIELIRLRVNDIDQTHLQVRIWNGKDFKPRISTLAPELLPAINRQIKHVQILLEEDMASGAYAGVWLPDALSRKYKNANNQDGNIYFLQYVGAMGVPITFLDKYNPDQFEIIDITDLEITIQD